MFGELHCKLCFLSLSTQSCCIYLFSKEANPIGERGSTRVHALPHRRHRVSVAGWLAVRWVGTPIRDPIAPAGRHRGWMCICFVFDAEHARTYVRTNKYLLRTAALKQRQLILPDQSRGGRGWMEVHVRKKCEDDSRTSRTPH